MDNDEKANEKTADELLSTETTTKSPSNSNEETLVTVSENNDAVQEEDDKTKENNQSIPLERAGESIGAKKLRFKPRSRKLTVAITLAILVVFAAAAAFWYYRYSNNKPINSEGSTNTSDNSQTVPEITELPTIINGEKVGDLCFVRLSYLVCTDKLGENRTRYDLPTLSDGSAVYWLATNKYQSKFVVLGEDIAEQAPKVAILDSSLKLIQEITIPEGFSAMKPTFSQDGNSLLMSLYKVGEAGNIYRYNIASGEFTQISNEDSCSHPNEIPDGRILASCLSSGEWRSRLFDLTIDQYSTPNTYMIDPIYTYNYDQDFDEVFYIGHHKDTKKGTIGYASISELSNGAQPLSFITLPDSSFGLSSAAAVARLDSNKLLIADGDLGKIINKSGEILVTIESFGYSPQILDTSKLSKSTQQAESPYERIVGLSGASTDFQDFLKEKFDEKDAQCRSNGYDARYPFSMRIIKIVRNEFASVGEGCGGGGANIMYVKNNDVWQYAFGIQSTPSCVTVNKYLFTKEIIPQCYEGNKLVDNPNP